LKKESKKDDDNNTSQALQRKKAYTTIENSWHQGQRRTASYLIVDPP
jgi:hypothetical protein